MIPQCIWTHLRNLLVSYTSGTDFNSFGKINDHVTSPIPDTVLEDCMKESLMEAEKESAKDPRKVKISKKTSIKAEEMRKEPEIGEG